MRITESELRTIINSVLDDMNIPSAQAQVGYCDADDVEEIGDDACEDCCDGECECPCCDGDCECQCSDTEMPVEKITIISTEEPFDVESGREELMSLFGDKCLHGDEFSEKASLFNRLMNSSIDDTNKWLH